MTQQASPLRHIVSRMLRTGIAIAATYTAFGCGSAIERWDVTVTENNVTMAVKMNQDFQVDGDLRVVYENYGEIFGETSADNLFNIGLSLNTSVFGAPELEHVTALPSGHPFPAFIRDVPMMHVVLKDNGNWKAHLFAALADGRQVIGVGYQMAAGGGDISGVGSYIYRLNNRPFGSLTLDGPSADDAEGGGVYIFADLSVLQGTHVSFKPEGTAEFQEVGGRDARKLDTRAGQKALVKQLMIEAERAGLGKAPRNN